LYACRRQAQGDAEGRISSQKRVGQP
jgi:hypothetical protein